MKLIQPSINTAAMRTVPRETIDPRVNTYGLFREWAYNLTINTEKP